MLTATQLAAAFDDEIDSLFDDEDSEVPAPTTPVNEEDSEAADEVFAETATPAEAEAVTQPEQYSERRATINIQLSDEMELQAGPLIGNRYRLRVPIAVLGSWVHPEYGDVTFTQEDFDDMMRNFSENVSGFEPPLFYGHPIDRESFGGAPAAGFLIQLYQLGDTLFGEFEAVAESYEQVKEGYYRYSSAEIVRNAVSKETGDPIGTLLVGTALTNRPFLTNMPRVKALADVFSSWADTTHHFLIPLLQTGDSQHDMADPTQSNNQSPAATAPASAPQPEQAAATQENFSEGQTPSQSQAQPQPMAEFLALAQQVETQRRELEETRKQAEAANQKLQQQELASKLNRLNTLNLSQAVKDSFKALIESDIPAEQEEVMFTALSEMSEQNKQLFSEQQGSQADETSPQNAEESNQSQTDMPAYFSEVMSQAKRVAEARQQRQAQLY